MKATSEKKKPRKQRYVEVSAEEKNPHKNHPGARASGSFSAKHKVTSGLDAENKILEDGKKTAGGLLAGGWQSLERRSRRKKCQKLTPGFELIIDLRRFGRLLIGMAPEILQYAYIQCFVFHLLHGLPLWQDILIHKPCSHTIMSGKGNFLYIYFVSSLIPLKHKIMPVPGRRPIFRGYSLHQRYGQQPHLFSDPKICPNPARALPQVQPRQLRFRAILTVSPLQQKSENRWLTVKQLSILSFYITLPWSSNPTVTLPHALLPLIPSKWITTHRQS